jgi:hypothetical protein
MRNILLCIFWFSVSGALVTELLDWLGVGSSRVVNKLSWSFMTMCALGFWLLGDNGAEKNKDHD